MWWTAVQLALLLLVLTCLVQCAAPPTTQKRESHPAPTKRATSSKAKITLEVRQPNAKETARSMVKPAATTRKVTTTKMTSPTPLKEFSLNEILFRGRQSNEANAFIKANDQRGKTLELTYEHVREQDLNDIEALVRKRNEIG